MAQVTGQAVCWLRRVLPDGTIELSGDGAYGDAYTLAALLAASVWREYPAPRLGNRHSALILDGTHPVAHALGLGA